MRRVRRHSDFEADFVAQLAWLVTHGDERWILDFEEGLVRISELIGKVPGVGALVDERSSVVLRKIFWPKGPFVAWYAYDRRRGDVWLVRLFHGRQLRPAADPRRWLPRRR